MTDRGPFAGRARAWLVSILAIAGFSIWVSGHAQEPAPYYQGKTITVYVGRTPGSGADLAARVFARFWSGHIPGEPTIVVRNLPGGGGTRVWNYGAEVAADIPRYMDFYRQVTGSDPSGEIYELYKWILPRVNNIVYAALLPPGTPEAQVNVLRDSFVQVTRDPGYRAEEQTMYGFSLPLIGAEEGTEILRSLYDVPEDVAAFLAAYVDALR